METKNTPFKRVFKTFQSPRYGELKRKRKKKKRPTNLHKITLILAFVSKWKQKTHLSRLRAVIVSVWVWAG